MKKNILMAVAATLMITGLQAQEGAGLKQLETIPTKPKQFVPLTELQKPAAPIPTNLVEAKKQQLLDLQAQKQQVATALEVQKATLLETQAKMDVLQEQQEQQEQQQKALAITSLKSVLDESQKQLILLQQKLETVNKAAAQKQAELDKLQAAQK